MKDDLSLTQFIVFSILLTMGIISLMALKDSHQLLTQKQRELDWFNATYLDKQGGTSLWPGTISTNKWVNYHLRSLDGGKNWYATHTTSNNEVIVDGPAETVYPGLMKTLQDWDNIVSYATKHGPINPNNTEDLKVLENNGFTVNRTTN